VRTRNLVRARAALPALVAGFALVSPARADSPLDPFRLPPGATAGDYEGTDVMIPMRDGVKLHAEVWRPKGVTGKLPILMTRTPYGAVYDRVKPAFETAFRELAAEKFIFVVEDLRGRFGSEGEFVMLRPPAGPSGVDESTDAYDSIDWLVKNLPDTTGTVGVFGISYGGWTTAMATIHPHPALKAVSVQASPEDMFLGDDFHHNGAFRLSYAWEYTAALETDGRTIQAFNFEGQDPYAWFLTQDDLANLDRKVFGRTLPTWRHFVDHPNYDAYWKAQATSPQMPAHPAVPNLIVAGWWDQEDFYGPMRIYENQERNDTEHRNFLVVGPWNHGGWASGAGSAFGPFEFGQPTAEQFRKDVEVPWFRHWLKGEGTLAQPEALVFETGSNEWKKLDAWPPKTGRVTKKLYLHANRALSFEPPSANEKAPDAFRSDPADPVPFRQRPISMLFAEKSTWPEWLADDQAPFAKRKDVVVYETPVLKEDVTLRGAVRADLFASTTGTDADWVVKLVDVYPDDESVPAAVRGRHLMIANDVFRGRFRKSFEHPQALAPNVPLEYSIDLHSAAHVFKAGHRIAVHVQSTWFPLIDRNPQTFTPSIFTAPPSAFRAQTHRIFHDPKHASAIAMDLAETATPAR
jgi:putative CocE/NonD family hydrolase